MPSLIDLTDSEWAVDTIKRQIVQLERLALKQDGMSDAELSELGDCLARLERVVGRFAADRRGEPLPPWLRRSSSPAIESEDDSSAQSG